MAFKRKSHNRAHSSTLDDVRKSVKISKQDQDKLKVRTINVHDPILNAVNEQQPFQEMQARDTENINSLSRMAQQTNLRDAFGNPIVRPDISNPTRSRDERPMDTIRSFEYAITGDPFYKSNLETPVYGWGVRPNFDGTGAAYQNGNPYDNYTNMGGVASSIPRNMEQPVFERKVTKEPEKKKRGLFGRKKKNHT